MRESTQAAVADRMRFDERDVMGSAIRRCVATILRYPNLNHRRRLLFRVLILAILTFHVRFAIPGHAQSRAVLLLPVIPARTFTVTDFGAVGDGTTLNTAALRAAIAACTSAGGGTVRIPAGRFLTGPLRLASSMDLHLDTGAVLLLSDDPRNFTLTRNRFENCLYATDAHDISVTGDGTIDGQGAYWWKTYVQPKYLPAGTPAPAHRPYMVVLSRCTRVLVQGVTLTNSPSFHLVPEQCRDVTIRGVRIVAPARSPNTDGIDPSGENFEIDRCTIDVGDDCIALKPNIPLRAGHVACEAFTIENCTFRHGHGMSIGGQTPGGLRDMVVRTCTFDGTETGIRMKANRGSGGVVENVRYENLTMHAVRTPVQITSYYPKIPADPAVDPLVAVDNHTPIWRQIAIKNVTAEGAETAGQIVGLPEMPISGVTLTGVRISARKGWQIYHARGIRFTDSIANVAAGPVLSSADADVAGLGTTPPLVAAPGAPVPAAAVDAGSGGTARTIQGEIDRHASSSIPVTILISPGTYAGTVTVPRGCDHVTLKGTGEMPSDVVIAVGAEQTALNAAGSDLRVENLTLDNTAGSTAGPNRALMTTGDRQVYDHVVIRGWQDTVWLRQEGSRAHFRDCEIWGSVDFIYGAGTALFEHCRIVERRPTGGVIAAPSTPADRPYGFIFRECHLVNATGSPANTALARPWRPYGAVAFLNCTLDDHITARAWREWDGREATCRFSEHASRTDAGAPIDTSARAPWGHELTDAEAKSYATSTVFGGWAEE